MQMVNFVPFDCLPRTGEPNGETLVKRTVMNRKRVQFGKTVSQRNEQPFRRLGLVGHIGGDSVNSVAQHERQTVRCVHADNGRNADAARMEPSGARAFLP